MIYTITRKLYFKMSQVKRKVVIETKYLVPFTLAELIFCRIKNMINISKVMMADLL